MKEKKDIATLIQEAVDAMVEHGGVPCVIICNKKTFRALSLELRRLDRFRELDNVVPLQLWFKYEGGDLPVLKFKYSPDDRIDVLDKDTYERLMKETKGKFSLSDHFEKERQKFKAIFDKYPCELLKGKYK